MEVAISPELERFVQQQVETGRFASPAEVFEASLRQMMMEDEFDEQDLADFEEAERDIAAGRVHTVQELRREFLGE